MHSKLWENADTPRYVLADLAEEEGNYALARILRETDRQPYRFKDYGELGKYWRWFLCQANAKDYTEINAGFVEKEKDNIPLSIACKLSKDSSWTEEKWTRYEAFAALAAVCTADDIETLKSLVIPVDKLEKVA